MALTTDGFIDRIRELTEDSTVEDVADGVVRVRFGATDHTDIGLTLEGTGWTLTDVWFEARVLLFRRKTTSVDLERFGARGHVRVRPDIADDATIDCRNCGTTFRLSEVATPTFGGLACPECGTTNFR